MRGYYCEFLRSPYWRAVRRQIIASDGRRCEQCGCHNDLQVHHTKYDELGTYMEYYGLVNLVLLCDACHAEAHGLPNPGRNWRGPEHISTILAYVWSQIPGRAA